MDLLWHFSPLFFIFSAKKVLSNFLFFPAWVTGVLLPDWIWIKFHFSVLVYGICHTHTQAHMYTYTYSIYLAVYYLDSMTLQNWLVSFFVCLERRGYIFNKMASEMQPSGNIQQFEMHGKISSLSALGIWKRLHRC